MPLSDYPSAELEPRNLSKEEISDPYLVISELFDYMHLPQVREALWNWLKVSVTGGFKNESSNERQNLLGMYEKMAKVMEAVYLIHKKVKPQ